MLSLPLLLHVRIVTNRNSAYIMRERFDLGQVKSIILIILFTHIGVLELRGIHQLVASNLGDDIIHKQCVCTRFPRCVQVFDAVNHMLLLVLRGSDGLEVE